MAKEILLKNVEGLDIIRFKNIKSMFEGSFKEVVFDLTINLDFFKAQTSLYAEEFNFLDMIEYLPRMYNRDLETFYFNPIGDQFSMKFDLQENGQIKVHSKLFNLMFTGKLEIEFIIEQSYIPELINQIEKAIKGNY
jgi:hypothetical protein